ncbi:MAG: hypothetical protein ACI9J2_001419 [Saprospiraceae bacterium]
MVVIPLEGDSALVYEAGDTGSAGGIVIYVKEGGFMV